MKRDTGTTGVILAVAVILILACGTTGPRPKLNLYVTDTATARPTATLTATATLTPTATPLPTATPRYPHNATVQGNWNCREKPFGVVIVYFTGGEQVKVFTEDGGWARVQYLEHVCWIVSAALK